MAFKDNIGMTEELHVALVETTLEDKLRSLIEEWKIQSSNGNDAGEVYAYEACAKRLKEVITK